ncbi:MAG: ferrous iron transport protein A [Candidatus Lokiarchaeota archaeon]|nr:ferrous iron transport protein A [Candidatus Lokiarchaeota archaeon]
MNKKNNNNFDITQNSKCDFNEIYLGNEKGLFECYLTECSKGEEIIVSRVEIGPKEKKRLANLGIVPDVKLIKKKSAPLKGPIEIFVKTTSLVLGRGLASKIRVKCQSACPR